MREWLSWWSTTLPRLGSRVRVPSRALIIKKKDIQKRISFFAIWCGCLIYKGFRCRHLPATGEWREGISFAQRVNSNGIPSIDRKSSWFGLTYGIGMCYAERSICKNGNRRVICLFLCIKICRKSLSFSYGECQKDFMEKRRGKKRWERNR